MNPSAPVQAVPVQSGTPVVVITQAAPQQNIIYVVDSGVQSAEDARVGICRRCRRQFTRPLGVNDGQAQYYRCAECEQHRLGDMFAGSCSVC